MEALGIDLKIILVQIVNFGILVFLLNKFLYKPILGAISKKNKEIDDISKGKEELASEQGTVERERETIIKSAQKEKALLLQEAKADAIKTKKSTLDKAEKQAKSMIDKAKKDIEAEKKKLSRDFEREVLSVSFAVAEKVIAKDADKKSVEKAYKDLGKVKSALWRN